MFENILIGLFGLLMVNYLVIIARQRIVKIVIAIVGNGFFGLSLFSDYIALPSYMIDLKYILIIILCVACVFSLWRHNRSGKITASDKRRLIHLQVELSLLLYFFFFYVVLHRLYIIMVDFDIFSHWLLYINLVLLLHSSW